MSYICECKATYSPKSSVCKIDIILFTFKYESNGSTGIPQFGAEYFDSYFKRIEKLFK